MSNFLFVAVLSILIIITIHYLIKFYLMDEEEIVVFKKTESHNDMHKEKYINLSDEIDTINNDYNCKIENNSDNEYYQHSHQHVHHVNEDVEHDLDVESLKEDLQLYMNNMSLKKHYDNSENVIDLNANFMETQDPLTPAGFVTKKEPERQFIKELKTELCGENKEHQPIGYNSDMHFASFQNVNGIEYK